MEAIQSQAIAMYEKNMSYLLTSHKDIHEKINTLTDEKYALDYLDGYFDIKELSTNRYLYAANSTDISKQLADLTNNTKSAYTFEGFPIYYINEKNRKNLDDKNATFEGILPIMEYYLDHTKDLKHMKSIEKYLFIGTGLGLHIPLIHKKIKADQYFIIEDDIEIFRLSLFTTDYAQIAKNATIYFSLNDDENVFINKFRVYLENTFQHNRFLKYTYFPAHSSDKIKLIQNALSSNNFAIFGYKSSLYKYIRPLEYINDGYHILNASKHFEDTLFFTKPTLLLASGPSLLKNIKFVQENQEKFIIVAVASSLKILSLHNIQPDVVTHIDGFDNSYNLFKGFDTEKLLHNSIAILGPFTPTTIKNFFQKENTFFYEENTEYFKNSGSLQGACIGSFSLLLSLFLNTKDLYILGLDLAFDQETGATHSKDHVTTTKIDLNEKDTLSNIMGIRDTVFPVPGNFSKTVYTTSLFHYSIQSLYNAVDKYKTDKQSIYNLNDGAKLKSTIPLKIENLDVKSFSNIDKKMFIASAREMLSSHSFNKLNKEDEISIRERLKHAKVIKKYLLKYKKDVKYTDANKYLYNLLGLELQIIKRFDRESYNLVSVYDDFFKYAIPIVFDFFNTEGMKNEKKHLKAIDTFIQKAIFEIVNIYEKSLEDFIEKRL